VGHGGGRIDVFVADAFAFGADGALEGFSGCLYAFAGFVGVFEPFPVLFRKFGIDGEEGVAVGPCLAVARGEFKCVLNGFEGSLFDPCVLDVLLGREHLFKLLAELEFADDATRFYVGENLLEISYAGGEFFHLTEAFLNLAEVRGDLTEGFGETGLQRSVKFFVNGDAHLLELCGVRVVELRKAVFNGEAQLLLLVVGFAGELVEAAMQRLASLDLIAVDLGDEVGEALRDRVEVLLNCGAEDLVRGFIVTAKGVEAVLEEAAEFGDGGGDLGSESGEVGSAGFASVFGFNGEVTPHLGEGGADVAFESLVAGIEPGELVGELGDARIHRRGGNLSAEEQDGEADQNDYLEDEEGSEHFDFPSPKNSTRLNELLWVLSKEEIEGKKIMNMFKNYFTFFGRAHKLLIEHVQNNLWEDLIMIVASCYFSYLVISIALTIWVARTLHRNGRLFLVDAFHGNEALADSVNQLLVVGFYLINVGYIALALKTTDPLSNVRQVIELESMKIGVVMLILGAMHFFNILVFAKMRSRAAVTYPPPPPPQLA